MFGAQDSVFTDLELQQAEYTSYSGPAGFYSEPSAGNAYPDYVTTLSVGAPDSLRTRWIELSTEDTAQARAWAVATAIHNGSFYTVDPGPPTVTRRYFQFGTSTSGAFPIVLRAHRASYLIRSGYDWFHPTPVIGVLIPRPIDRGEARGVAEYLWFKDHHRSDAKVLSSFSRTSDGSVLHTIFYVHGISGLGFFGYVYGVELLRDDYRIDTATGAINFLETSKRQIWDSERSADRSASFGNVRR